MLFTGIDISKLTFNASILNDNKYLDHKFKNNDQGFKAFIKWVEKFKLNSIFCMESTGIYSLSLAKFLDQQQKTTLLGVSTLFRT